MTLGTAVFCYGVNAIIIPNHLGEGGITGASILLKYVFNIEPEVTNLVLNGILLIVGWKFLDRMTLYYTIYVVFAMSFFFKYINPAPFLPQNTIIAALVAGVVSGTGIGLIVKAGGTTAGGDIIAKLINKFLGINYSVAVLMVDVCIITPLMMVIGLENTAITLTMAFVYSKVLNFITEGMNPKKSLMIISQEYQAIADDIQTNIERGITIINGYGYYSKSNKEIIYLVVNRNQLMAVQKIVNKHDPSAFITINDVNQVHGEGFTFFLSDKLTAPQTPSQKL